jgi:hypothetical protein
MLHKFFCLRPQRHSDKPSRSGPWPAFLTRFTTQHAPEPVEDDGISLPYNFRVLGSVINSRIYFTLLSIRNVSSTIFMASSTPHKTGEYGPVSQLSSVSIFYNRLYGLPPSWLKSLPSLGYSEKEIAQLQEQISGHPSLNIINGILLEFL